MNGLDRALKYFVRQAQIYVLFIFAGSFGTSVYQCFVLGGPMDFMQILYAVPGILLWLSLMAIYIVGMTNAAYWYPMLISVGCRRRNAYLGTLAMNLLIIAEILLLDEILWNILDAEERWLGMPAVFAMFLTMEGVSKLAGIAAMKWGRSIYIITAAGAVVFSISVGFSGGIMADAGSLIEMTNSWQPLLIGAAVFAAANMAGSRLIRHYEVKA